MKTIDIVGVYHALLKSGEKLDKIRKNTTDANEAEELDDLIEDINSAFRNFLHADWN